MLHISRQHSCTYVGHGTQKHLHIKKYFTLSKVCPQIGAKTDSQNRLQHNLR
jgi:hypothetical protein